MRIVARMRVRSALGLLAASMTLVACDLGTQSQQTQPPQQASGAATAASGAATSSAAAVAESAAATAEADAASEPASPTPVPTPTPPPVGGVYAGTVGGQLDPRVADLPHRVYVPNELSNDVAVIDPETLEVIGRFPAGPFPEHISPDWDLSTLHVSNMNGATLTVIDPTTEEAVETKQVPFPYNLYFTPDGEKAIVIADYLSSCCTAHNGLHFFDRETWEPIKFVNVPYAGVNHLDFSADGSYLVVSTETSGHVVKVDIETMEIVGAFYVGGSAVDVRLAPEGDIFYVANQGTHRVDLVNGDTLEVVGSIPTGVTAASGTHAFAYSRDVSRLFVTNRLEGSISVIDTKTREVIDTWIVGGSPDMATVSPDGDQLWVSNRYHGTVIVLDPQTGELLATIETGGNPHGLTYWPQPGTISLGHNGNMR